MNSTSNSYRVNLVEGPAGLCFMAHIPDANPALVVIGMSITLVGEDGSTWDAVIDEIDGPDVRGRVVRVPDYEMVVGDD